MCQAACGSPCRIVQQHSRFIDAHGDDIVKTPGSVFEEDDERTVGRHVRPYHVERSGKRLGSPAARADGVGQDVGSDTSGAAIDERGELLRAGMTIAVKPQDHGNSGAAAECFGLGEIRDVERQLAAGRNGGPGRAGIHEREKE